MINISVLDAVLTVEALSEIHEGDWCRIVHDCGDVGGVRPLTPDDTAQMSDLIALESASVGEKVKARCVRTRKVCTEEFAEDEPRLTWPSGAALARVPFPAGVSAPMVGEGDA